MEKIQGIHTNNNGGSQVPPDIRKAIIEKTLHPKITNPKNENETVNVSTCSKVGLKGKKTLGQLLEESLASKQEREIEPSQADKLREQITEKFAGADKRIAGLMKRYR